MTINEADIERLLEEIPALNDDSLTGDDWSAKHNIDIGALAVIVDINFGEFMKQLAGGLRGKDAFANVIANAFMLGYEAALQYGPPRTNLTNPSDTSEGG